MRQIAHGPGFAHILWRTTSWRELHFQPRRQQVVLDT
jgi:hypothetical protein